jgi:hypothetical protein
MRLCQALAARVASRPFLAMQKVVGSNPIIRFLSESPAQAGFLLGGTGIAPK